MKKEKESERKLKVGRQGGGGRKGKRVVVAKKQGEARGLMAARRRQDLSPFCRRNRPVILS